MATVLSAGRAWAHHCCETLLNLGAYEAGDTCAACCCDTRPGEIVEYHLVPARPAAPSDEVPSGALARG